jgi:tripartite-type tricarboxylate transporter receptor subunit TctC
VRACAPPKEEPVNVGVRHSRRLAVVAALGILFVGAFVHPAWPQAAKSIRIIVPFPPGGPADFVARVLAEQMGRPQGLNVVVENRPGAGSVVGTDAASRAPPPQSGPVRSWSCQLPQVQTRRGDEADGAVPGLSRPQAS